MSDAIFYAGDGNEHDLDWEGQVNDDPDYTDFTKATKVSIDFQDFIPEDKYEELEALVKEMLWELESTIPFAYSEEFGMEIINSFHEQFEELGIDIND